MVLDTPCYLVPKGHPESEDAALEWRVSFSVVERAIMKELTIPQRKAYLCLIHFLKGSTKKERVKSYYLKTTFLWTLEEVGPHFLDETENNMFSFITMVLEKLCTFFAEKNIPSFFVKNQNLLKDFTGKDIRSIHEMLSNTLPILPQKMSRSLGACPDLSVLEVRSFFVSQLLFDWDQTTSPSITILLERLSTGLLSPSAKDVNMMISVVLYVDILSSIGTAILNQDFKEEYLNLTQKENLKKCAIKIWHLCNNIFPPEVCKVTLSDTVQQLRVPLTGTAKESKDAEPVALTEVRGRRVNEMDFDLRNKADDVILRKVILSLIEELSLEGEAMQGLTEDETRILQLISGELDNKIEGITKIRQFISGQVDSKIDEQIKMLQRQIEKEKMSLLTKRSEFIEKRKDSTHFINLKDRRSIVSSVNNMKKNLAGCDCDPVTKLDDAFKMFLLKATEFIEKDFIKCFNEPLLFVDVLQCISRRVYAEDPFPGSLTEDLKTMYQYGFQSHKFGLPSLRNYISFKFQHTINERVNGIIREEGTNELGLVEIWSYWVEADGDFELVDTPQNIVMI